MIIYNTTSPCVPLVLFPLTHKDISERSPYQKQKFPRTSPVPFFIEVPKEAPSVTNIVWAPSVAPSMALSVTNIVWAPSIAPSMAPSVAPSVIISLICFPVPPPIFQTGLTGPSHPLISDWLDWS